MAPSSAHNTRMLDVTAGDRLSTHETFREGLRYRKQCRGMMTSSTRKDISNTSGTSWVQERLSMDRRRAARASARACTRAGPCPTAAAKGSQRRAVPGSCGERLAAPRTVRRDWRHGQEAPALAMVTECTAQQQGTDRMEIMNADGGQQSDGDRMDSSTAPDSKKTKHSAHVRICWRITPFPTDASSQMSRQKPAARVACHAVWRRAHTHRLLSQILQLHAVVGQLRCVDRTTQQIT